MDGRDLHAVTPAPGGFYVPPDGNHEIVPEPGTFTTAVGYNAGKPADLQNSDHYPVEATCRCGWIIRSDHFYASWYHLDGKP